MQGFKYLYHATFNQITQLYSSNIHRPHCHGTYVFDQGLVGHAPATSVRSRWPIARCLIVSICLRCKPFAMRALWLCPPSGAQLQSTRAESDACASDAGPQAIEHASDGWKL